MSPRRLSDEERTLWLDVARSIVPLRKTAIPEPEPPAPEANSKAKPRSKPAPVARMQPVGKSGVASPAATPLAPFNRRTKRRLARGTETIDARFDLHGLTQAEAHAALQRFLRTAQSRGCRTVLIITGKGGTGYPYSERGVLKRQVPMWLNLPEFRSMIVSFEAATVTHGGEGAMYVRLRQIRGDGDR
jgi:DNA-nicking Smr family endonuclease